MGGVSTETEGLLTNEGSTGLTRDTVSTTKVNQDSSSAASELQIVGVFINPLVPLRPARDPVSGQANVVSIPCHGPNSALDKSGLAVWSTPIPLPFPRSGPSV